MPKFEETELYKLITANQQSHETWETALKLIQSDPMTARLVQPETGDTFLHVLVRTVAQEGWLGTCTEPLVFALSNAGTDVNAINKEGDTALHTLLKEKSAQYLTARALLRVGVDPSVKDANGDDLNTMLEKDTSYQFNKGYLHRIHTKQGIWRAVEESDAETVEILFRSWVRVKASRNGQTLKNLAVATGKPKIIQLLDKYSATNELVHAAYAKDVDKMKKLLNIYGDQIDINSTDLASLSEESFYPANSILHLVIGHSQDATRLLVERGADVNLMLQHGPTYLFRGPASEKTYKVLLKHADLSLTNPEGNNLIYMLASNIQKQVSDQFVLKLLHKYGLDLLTNRNTDGETVRDCLVTQYNNPGKNSHKYQQYIKHYKRYIQLIDRVVVSMVRHNEWDQIETLIVRGYGYHLMDIVDEEGRSLVTVAQMENATDVLELLQSVSVFRKQALQLFESIKKGDEDEVNLYLISVEHELPRDLGKRSLLHLAVLYGQYNIARLLCESCSSLLDSKDSYQRTPLHYAVALGNQKYEQLLMKYNCDLQIKDLHGLTPEDYRPENRSKYPHLKLDNFEEDERCCLYGQYGLVALFYIRLKESVKKEDLLLAKDVLSDMGFQRQDQFLDIVIAVTADMKMEDIVFEDFQILEECGVIKGEEYEPIQFIAAKSVNSGDPGPIEILKTFIDQGLDIEEEWQRGTCDSGCLDSEEHCGHKPKTIREVGGWKVQKLLEELQQEEK